MGAPPGHWREQQRGIDEYAANTQGNEELLKDCHEITVSFAGWLTSI